MKTKYVIYAIDDGRIIIRKMKKCDIKHIVPIIKKTMGEEKANYAIASFNHTLLRENNDSVWYIAVFNDEVVGVIGLHGLTQLPDVWLSWFAISPEYQRKGIGSLLMEYIQVVAREYGCKRLFIETYVHPDFVNALMFYRKMKFNVVGIFTNYLSDGSPSLTYGKDL